MDGNTLDLKHNEKVSDASAANLYLSSAKGLPSQAALLKYFHNVEDYLLSLTAVAQCLLL